MPAEIDVPAKAGAAPQTLLSYSRVLIHALSGGRNSV